MSSNFKSVPTAHADPVRAANLYRLAIVGAGTLRGKEVAEVLGDRNFPSLDIKLLDDNESLGKLESVGDEVSFIQSVRAEQFEKIDFTFFASDQECTRQNWKKAQKAGSAIVDLSYALEDEPDANVKSPWIQRQLGQMLTPELQPGPAVVAHPAAVVLALLLLRIQKRGAVKRVVANVFEPASEHGQKGMDELHEQTVNLLSFQPLPKKVFDAQVAFNMVARYGEQSVQSLAAVERRVLKHYKRIAGKDAPLPTLLMVQAPIFHGYALSLHVEMEKLVEIDAISKALAGEHVTLTGLAEESPSNVNAAGQGDVLVSIQPDANLANGLWLWASADNLRIAAATAVECAENMAATRPKGKIQ
jgi:aspartate-semialdehyde dehydrogenase